MFTLVSSAMGAGCLSCRAWATIQTCGSDLNGDLSKASVHAEELRRLYCKNTAVQSRSYTIAVDDIKTRYHIWTVDAGTGGSLGTPVVGSPLEPALGVTCFCDVLLLTPWCMKV